MSTLVRLNAQNHNVALGLCAAMLLGCAKESITPGASSKHGPRLRIVQFIEAAQEHREGGSAKNGETFSTDSAVWYVEAALNYAYAQVGRGCLDLTLDSAGVSLPGGEDGIQAAAVYEAYNALAALIAPLTTEEQHVALVDVLEPLPGASSLLVVSTIGSGYEKGAPNSSYTAQQDFLWGSMAVQPNTVCVCGQNPNSTAFCAEKTIQQRINAANLHPIGPDEYITDVETWNVNRHASSLSLRRYQYSAPEMQGPAPLGDGYRDTKTFYWRTNSILPPGGSTCVQDTEMSFWTGNASTGTWSAVTFIQGLHCPTKLFLGCVITPHSWAPLGTPGVSHRIHECAFTFGRIFGSDS